MRRSWSVRRAGLLPRLLLPLGLFAFCVGCGGQKTTLEVQIVTPPGDDPFAGAAQVRLSLLSPPSSGTGATGGSTDGTTTVANQMMTAPVQGGHFDTSLDVNKPDMNLVAHVLVEALDGNNVVIGRGRSPDFQFAGTNSTVTVYVGRPGAVTGTSLNLFAVDDASNSQQTRPVALTDLAGCVLRGAPTTSTRGLGALLVGGVDAAGNTSPSALLFDPVTQLLLFAGNPLVPRHGAALVPSAEGAVGQQAILWGGALSKGGMEQPLPTALEIFDPSQTITGIFTPPAMDLPGPGGPGAKDPVVTEVQLGVFLVSGGQGLDGKALAQAALLRRFPGADSTAATRPSGQRIAAPMGMQDPMTAPRRGHSVTPVSFTSGGVGALLFGGLPDDAGDTAPVAEQFLLGNQRFTALPLMTMGDKLPVASRSNHVAVPLDGKAADGRVLIAGGVLHDVSGPKVQGSALIVSPATGLVEVRDPFLATPRQGASATLMGGELLICGGLGDDGKALANCEIFSAATLMKARDPVSLPGPRANHLALLLDNDQLLLVGGVGADGKTPLSTIDVYTPR